MLLLKVRQKGAFLLEILNSSHVVCYSWMMQMLRVDEGSNEDRDTWPRFVSYTMYGHNAWPQYCGDQCGVTKFGRAV